jgi:hypothetical protein
MEKEFVPYTEALALKELGFNELSPTFYSEKGFLYRCIDFYGYSTDKLLPNECPVPTFSQAFRWFREKYRLKGEIDTADMIWSKWSFNIELKGSSYILYSGLTEKIYFNSYEEAELECLEKLIEIVKEKI